MSELLSPDGAVQRLAALNGPWLRDGDEIVLDLKLADFAAAVELLGRIAAIAEERGHHPDLRIHGWNRLEVRLSTHSAGGLTALDFDLAADLDPILPG